MFCRLQTPVLKHEMRHYLSTMKAYQANIINAIALIAMGLWGYLSESAELRSMTALIPVIFGAILLPMTPGIKSENKIIAHIAVTLTLLLLIMLIAMPLRARLAAQDSAGTIRVLIMIATCTFAMISFIQSFIAARKARKATGT